MHLVVVNIYREIIFIYFTYNNMSVNQAVEIYESVIFVSFVLVKRNMFFFIKAFSFKHDAYFYFDGKTLFTSYF